MSHLTLAAVLFWFSALHLCFVYPFNNFLWKIKDFCWTLLPPGLLHLGPRHSNMTTMSGSLKHLSREANHITWLMCEGATPTECPEGLKFSAYLESRQQREVMAIVEGRNVRLSSKRKVCNSDRLKWKQRYKTANNSKVDKKHYSFWFGPNQSETAGRM